MKNFQFFNWILCNLLVISCAYSDKIGNGKCKLRAKKCDKISFEQFDQNCSSVDSTKLLIKKNSTDKIVISDEHFPSNYNSYEDSEYYSFINNKNLCWENKKLIQKRNCCSAHNCYC